MVENRNMSVGLFVSAAIIMFIAFTVWITGKKGDEPTTFYSIVFDRDVSGLSLGGPVYFLGVNIGQVDNMVIMAGDPVAIRVDIEVLESAPVDGGTWAGLAAQGITGVSVINLSSDPGQHPPLKATDGYEYPVLPQRMTGFGAIMSSAPKLLAKMETLLDRAAAMLDETNYQLVQSMLTNVESLTASLAGQESAISNLPTEMNKTMADVQSLVGDLQEILGDANPEIQASLQNVERATSDLAEITGRLDGWMLDSDPEMNDFLANGLGQVPELIEDARRTLREMEKLLASLRADPDRLIYKTEQDAVNNGEK